MSAGLILLVLCAALLHATWNLIVKGGGDPLFEAALNALGGGLAALCLLPLAPVPAPEGRAILLCSALFHLLYYLGVAATYRAADMSLGYTLMRGSAPLLTALALLALGAPLSPGGWGGLALLCAGILSLALEPLRRRGGDMRGIGLALATACIICGYTLADGYGGRIAGTGVGYTLWLYVINIVPLGAWMLARHRAEFLAYLRRRGPRRTALGLSGGLAGLASYGIAIWAMTKAPIALVAALRESSVIFGMLLAVLFLGERLSASRVLAVLLVAGGAMLLKLA